MVCCGNAGYAVIFSNFANTLENAITAAFQEKTKPFDVQYI